MINFKDIAVYIALVLVGVVIGSILSGMTSQDLGGVYETNYKYFYQGFSAGNSDEFQVNSSGNVIIGEAAATSSLDVNKLCMIVTDEGGTEMYAFFSSATLDWATSSTSCL